MQRVSHDAKVILNFSSPMVFPSDFAVILNDRNFTDPNKHKYIDVRVLSTKGETDQGNLKGWNITSVEENWI